MVWLRGFFRRQSVGGRGHSFAVWPCSHTQNEVMSGEYLHCVICCHSRRITGSLKKRSWMIINMSSCDWRRYSRCDHDIHSCCREAHMCWYSVQTWSLSVLPRLSIHYLVDLTLSSPLSAPLIFPHSLTLQLCQRPAVPAPLRTPRLRCSPQFRETRENTETENRQTDQQFKRECCLSSQSITNKEKNLIRLHIRSDLRP